ncbi:MAG: 1-deoxy-D-xylulose-5-phosphate reductoisomerase [Oscillospiraceae bacterium]|jgi:1-deoxy-D-xylulose-5-phosphate reductoisomerase
MTISVLGSTGSVGRQTLQVAAEMNIKILALTAGRNVRLLEDQVRRFRPRLAVAAYEDAAKELKTLVADTDTEVDCGEDGLLRAAAAEGADTIVSAIVGTAGLSPTLAAVQSGRRVALANKESLVCAGEMMMEQAKRSGSMIIPVDSEHSAIFQCLRSGRRGEVRRLIITASGGPFYGWDKRRLAKVTPEMALKHPNWEMGAKITIDSATLMNKGLEFIEAMHLFGMPHEAIDIVIHRESVIHSMVEFRDGSVIAQLALPDMRLPIRYALTYPFRAQSNMAGPDFTKMGSLSFGEPDMEAFPCLPIALNVSRAGGNLPAAMSAANEVAVEAFLKERIGFNTIPFIISDTLTKMEYIENPTLEEILDSDRSARIYAEESCRARGGIPGTNDKH